MVWTGKGRKSGGYCCRVIAVRTERKETSGRSGRQVLSSPGGSEKDWIVQGQWGTVIRFEQVLIGMTWLDFYFKTTLRLLWET